MTYRQNHIFVKDLQKVLKKHKLIMMIGDPISLVQSTKSLDGLTVFFTKGEKKIQLRGGGKFKDEASITLMLHKNRYTEEDGN